MNQTRNCYKWKNNITPKFTYNCILMMQCLIIDFEIKLIIIYPDRKPKGR